MAVKVGLTGGIGSGKTTVADCFGELGIQVIDADRIARALTEPGTAQFAEIMECFGGEIMDSDGRLDRKQLGRVVFNSPQKRKQLESILHPPIRVEMYALAQQDAQRYCVLDIPLLVESGQYRDMRRVVVVACAPELRARRLREQRDMTDAQITQVMETQASEAERLARADDVIDNNGTPEDIETQVAALHQAYWKSFADK